MKTEEIASAEECEFHAAECLEILKRETDTRTHRLLFERASAWRRRAEEIRRRHLPRAG